MSKPFGSDPAQITDQQSFIIQTDFVTVDICGICRNPLRQMLCHPDCPFDDDPSPERGFIRQTYVRTLVNEEPWAGIPPRRSQGSQVLDPAPAERNNPSNLISDMRAALKRWLEGEGQLGLEVPVPAEMISILVENRKDLVETTEDLMEQAYLHSQGSRILEPEQAERNNPPRNNPPNNSWCGVSHQGGDYNQLVSCLRSNFKEALPDIPDRDPQDMIQFMAAYIMKFRRERGDYGK